MKKENLLATTVKTFLLENLVVNKYSAQDNALLIIEFANL